MNVYLDNAATTKPYEEVVAFMNMINAEIYGNPSSAHSMGIESENIIKKASDLIAGTLNTKRDNLIFTSCGTEADNMALMQPFYNLSKIKEKGIITSSIEHPAVSEPCDYLRQNGADVVTLPVNRQGLVDPELLRAAINDKTALISIMYVNNEVGTIQPIEDICAVKSDAAARGNRDLMLHTDAVQAYGKLDIDVNSKELSAIDMMTLSSHKIHGTKGTGALYVKDPNKIKPLLKGGGQQRGLRSGTENVAGIGGFGCAAEIQHSNLKDNMNKIANLRKILLEGFLDNIDEVKINSPMEVSTGGEAGKCIPSILSASFPGTKGEVILHSLELAGIFVSTQSACSSKKKSSSPVLTAMGLSGEEIEGTIRFSISAFNTEDEMLYTVEETKKAVEKMRKITGYRKR